MLRVVVVATKVIGKGMMLRVPEVGETLVFLVSWKPEGST